MSVAIIETSSLDRASMILGTAMRLAWAFVIGIGGFFLLAVTAYGFMTQNHAMAAISTFFLCAPLLMTLGWGILSLAVYCRKNESEI
jgi:hypothetical protein